MNIKKVNKCVLNYHYQLGNKMNLHNLRNISLFIVLVLMYSCAFSILEPNDPAADPRMTPINLSKDFEIATPESQGLDSLRLSRALSRAEQIPGLRNLVVLRNGFVVIDNDYTSADDDTLVDIRAATIFVTAALLGIAIDNNNIDSEFQTLEDLAVPAFTPLPAEKLQLSLRHLLTMTTGWQWGENQGSFGEWVTSPNQITHIANLNQVEPRGIFFNYTSGAAHLLSIAIAEKAGESTLQFAKRHLFDPLNISPESWLQDANDFHYGSHGLKLTAVEMAKLGQLFLQEGFSGSDLILSPGWVRDATNTQFPLSRNYSGIKNLNFGYLFWTQDVSFNRTYFVWGYGGQFIYCVPDRNLVIVTIADAEQLNFAQAQQQSLAILELVGRDLLSSVRPVRRVRDMRSIIN